MKKINRRQFVTASTAASALPLAALGAHGADAPAGGRDFYELRQYSIDNEKQKAGFDVFFREAAIPALNQIGNRPVGVFYAKDQLSPIYVLLRHRTLDSFVAWKEQVMALENFRTKGEAFLDAPREAPAYNRCESSLFIAFSGMPQIETPLKAPGRVLQLRIYENPSVRANRKKIEMFNDAGEIKIFREVGLRPVFFGEALAGARMPNLTYMLAFESEEELKANWGKFGRHPEWQKLRQMPEYADSKLVSKITSVVLKPAEYSQI